MSSLCLGSCQWGMLYGIHEKPIPTRAEVSEMLDFAVANKIEHIDTARAYGYAEVILGEYEHPFKIISKLSPKTMMPNPNVIVECRKSRNRFGRRLDGFLFHTPEQIYDDKLLDQLKACKKEGLADNIGVSIYDVTDGLSALRKGIDYIQIPYSVLDQRFDKSSFFQVAKDKGIKVFARSAFLQGLLVTRCIPERLKDTESYVNTFREIAKEYHIAGEDRDSLVETALLFSLTHPYIDYTVFGVRNISQLKQDFSIYKQKDKYDYGACRQAIKDRLSNIPKSVVLPSLWAKPKEGENRSSDEKMNRVI